VKGIGSVSRVRGSNSSALARFVAFPAALAAALLVAVSTPADAQLRASYSEGEDVSPAFEGWIPNEDGTFDIVFGYMNRNWEEEIHVPVGPENYFSLVSPGALDDLEASGYDASFADQGQPSYLLPRRNRFTFRVTVPADFASGDRELVWTLTTNGSTERAYASLARDYMVDNMVIMSETGALGAGSSDDVMRGNEPPVIDLEQGTRTVRQVTVGEPLVLAARVTDDGIPRTGGLVSALVRPNRSNLTPEQQLQRALNPPRRITVGKVNGLHFAWFVYRGDGSRVTFDPPQVKTWEDTRAFANSPWAPTWVPPAVPDDNRWLTTVRFDAPGIYVLRGRADDGGLFSDVEVTVEVTGAGETN
jgi:hypothetical protein